MNRRTILASFTTFLLCSGSALAQDHAAHGGVGAVNFPNSCAASVQPDLARGVAMLHSFWFGAGEQTFREVLVRDPSCAVADWGIAAILMLNPLAGSGATPKGAEAAQAAIDAGRHTGAKTQRERDYIEAVAAYYQDYADRPERARQEARAKAFEALAARYPDDDEAQIFSALYIAGTQSQSDQTYAAYRKASAILERESLKYPDHPGVVHYLIHVYDAPALAEQGVPAARRYAGLAPDAPHALHMPSHIFTRVGAWDESAATNRRSFAVAAKGKDIGEAYHASDYAVYADLQLARDAGALVGIEAASQLKSGIPLPPALAYAAAAMPARYALERGDWCGAMQLAAPAGSLPYADALTWFARAVGAARCGQVATAEKDARQLDLLHAKLVDMGNAYWAREVEIQQHAAAGWIAFAAKHPQDGLKLMRQAADLEDTNEKHIVTPGRVLPARELLADMLLEAGQPNLALKEYQVSQRREPNRFRGIYGAARSTEALGDRDLATAYYRRLLDLGKAADPGRPELVHAAGYIAG